MEKWLKVLRFGINVQSDTIDQRCLEWIGSGSFRGLQKCFDESEIVNLV